MLGVRQTIVIYGFGEVRLNLWIESMSLGFRPILIPGYEVDEWIELRFALVGVNPGITPPEGVGEADMYTFTSYNLFARRVTAGSKKRCQGQAYPFPPGLDSIRLRMELLD